MTDQIYEKHKYAFPFLNAIALFFALAHHLWLCLSFPTQYVQTFVSIIVNAEHTRPGIQANTS